MNEVTRILSAVEQGDPHAANQLLPLVYDEKQLGRDSSRRLGGGRSILDTSARSPCWATAPKWVAVRD